MARLTLRDGRSYADLGQLVLKLAGEVQSGQTLDPKTLTSDFQDLVTNDLLQVEPGELRTGEGGYSGDQVAIRLHYDQTLTSAEGSLRIVNIVLPDLEGKSPEGDAGLAKVAQEAFGFITICGCAG